MKLHFTLSILLLLSLGACNRSKIEPSLEGRIMGEWLIVSEHRKSDQVTTEDENGVMIHLGCFYHASITLNQDKTYFINKQADKVYGRWSLDSDNKKITLTCEGDPTIRYVFEVSLTEAYNMIWDSSSQRLTHRKIE